MAAGNSDETGRAVACWPRRARADGGFVAGAEALVFGVLIFVGGTLLAVNAWGVIDAKFAATAAAREATRAAVEAPPGAPLLQHARAAAEEALLGHGKRVERMEGPVPVDGVHQDRCGHLSFEVAYNVPVTIMPWGRAFNGVGSIRVVGRHAELVDPFRAGLVVPDQGQRPEDLCAF